MTSKSYLFICGFPSSGTELLKSIVRAHPAIWLIGEYPFLFQVAQRHAGELHTQQQVAALERDLRRNDIYRQLGRRGLNPDERSQLRHFRDVFAAMLGSDRPVVGSKTPQYATRLSTLRALFPTSKVLLIVRDPRDVCLSWRKKWGKDVLWCAHKWQQRMGRAQHELASTYGDSGMLLRYEDLLRYHRRISEDICTLVGLPFSERMLNFHEHEAEVLDGHINYGRSIVSENVRKWESALPARTVRRIESIADETMRRFGYEPVTNATPAPLSAAEKVRGVVRDAASLVFVGNRARRRGKLRYRWTSIAVEFKKLLGGLP